MSAGGVFVSFEGGEASGKSTQARRLADRWLAAGRSVVLTREPGGTAGAERLRALLLAPDADWSERAEILLHFAARADHLDRLILPALARGDLVITDRFSDSTLAYQGYGRDADRALIEALADRLPRRPDRTVVLLVDAAERERRRIARGGVPDRYESETTAFHARVERGYRAIAAASPDRCRVVDGSGDADAVAVRVEAALADLLG